jgi:DHA2 family multidrug resistance protein
MNATLGSRWLISLTVMLTTVMVILDTTIVNVALPHMMGALGANTDQITWVLTSFIVAQAIVIPMTGFLTDRFGRRFVVLVSIAGFVTASALCGLATSLAEMVIFRLLQGFFGAPLLPLSQAVLVDTFPREERGKAMALWGMGVMLGPVLGPTLGGYITDNMTWRWVFYINVPVGALNLLLVARLIQETPTRELGIDWPGLVAMAVGIGTLQIVLDRGNEEGWFDSGLIIMLGLLSLTALIVFVLRGWNRKDNIVNLRLFEDRNLATASLMVGAFGLGLYGTIAMQPIMLESLFGYPASTTGLVMAPRGVASALSMFVVSRLISRYDSRALVAVGLALAASGTYVMTGYDLSVSPFWIVWPSILQGLGIGMIFVPLSTLAYETLPRASTDAGAGLYNLVRTVGASMGISIVSTVLSRAGQYYWQQLGGHINPYNPALYDWLNGQQLGLANPLAAQLLGQELLRHSTMKAFLDVYWVITLSFLVVAPLLLIIRKPSVSLGD